MLFSSNKMKSCLKKLILKFFQLEHWWCKKKSKRCICITPVKRSDAALVLSLVSLLPSQPWRIQMSQAREKLRSYFLIIYCANRAFVWMKLEEFEKAQVDLLWVIKMGNYSKESFYKIYQRLGIVLQKLQKTRFQILIKALAKVRKSQIFHEKQSKNCPNFCPRL